MTYPAQLVRCTRLAQRLGAVEPIASTCAAELRHLRALFVSHDELEIRALDPLLAASGRES